MSWSRNSLQDELFESVSNTADEISQAALNIFHGSPQTCTIFSILFSYLNYYIILTFQSLIRTLVFHFQKQWQDECLSLTLEEVVHIRSVLTKAELESLPVEGQVKDDVEKRKVSCCPYRY